jgi:aminoglycoside phosphotransferase (APT) family kinase protein
MMSADPRCQPLVLLHREQVAAMLAPVVNGAGIHETTCVDGGLVNTVYRVVLDDPLHTTFALRVSPRGSQVPLTEHRWLRELAANLPVPELVWVDVEGTSCGYPYLAYRWIDGVTLNRCRQGASANAWLELADPIGTLLARVAGALRSPRPVAEDSVRPLGSRRVVVEVAEARSTLRAGRARDRLGSSIADRLIDLLSGHEEQLSALARDRSLVHGDFGGRNVLVATSRAGRAVISGVLDWESAAIGSALWDVGSFFRYARRYGPEFRDQFEYGYRRAGGELPSDWWRTARVLDGTRLIAILSEERCLPTVFAECHTLLEALLVDSAAPLLMGRV